LELFCFLAFCRLVRLSNKLRAKSKSGQVQNLGMNFLGIDLAKSKKEEIDTSYTSESRPKSFDFGTVQRLALKDSDEALVFLLSK
jgi:hypothetical protein